MNMSTRNPNEPIENLAIGQIIEVDGSRLVAELNPTLSELSRVYAGETYPIGQFGSIIRIHFGRRLVYALVGRLRMKSEFQAERGLVPASSSDERIVEADLFGEGEWVHGASGEWELRFERGVSTYPLPQQTVYLTPKAELRFIYGRAKGAVVQLGQHVGSGGTPCLADLNELLGKHTAVLGSTGAGKSGTVAAIIHSILERGDTNSYDKWKPRIIILDPHGEYGSAFADHTKLSSDDGTLTLPYWLLDFQETVALLIGKTEFVATSQANIVKSALMSAREEGAQQLGLDANLITVDSPVPYKLSALKTKIEADKPPQASKQDSHNSILQKLEVLMTDARLRFMMTEGNGDGNDPFPEVIKQLTSDGPQPRIIDLSGVPNEVAGVSSAGIARTLFNLKIWQTQPERESDPVLVVCEEAHRYVPNRGEAQYEAAQEAIRRIAKEGRKYGVGLLLVSQRPSEVEATVLSQCNSWIVLRITNDTDREHVRSILPDSMSGLTKMLSGLRRQEAIFVGQAAMLPSRILIRDLKPEQLPKSNDIDFDKGWQNDATPDAQIEDVVNRWRYQRR
ncbi:ATP-binding protein [Cupriavidus nantongensis]|uniref:ATP-binding protein n=1 Tax=Cupriavidus nantongensis TaxID=1796606 RepID=UPI000B0D311D|nr:ATP-binding protein [Cupriavidus nantongensis]